MTGCVAAASSVWVNCAAHQRSHCQLMAKSSHSVCNISCLNYTGEYKDIIINNTYNNSVGEVGLNI